jgi:hypothetical protein
MFKFLKKWEHPGAGFIIWNDEDQETRERSYDVLWQHRESDVLTETNFKVALERLEAKEAALGGSQDELPWVRVERDSSDLVGWVEAIYIADTAPEELLQCADDLLASLKDYPVLDEDRWSQAENESVNDYWDSAPEREKVDLIVEHCKVDEVEAERLVEAGEFPDKVYYALRDWNW